MRYMTTPFEVTGQIAQRDTKAGEHHHWNSQNRCQEGTVHYVEPSADNETKTLADKHHKYTDRKEHPEAHPFHRLIAPEIYYNRKESRTNELCVWEEVGGIS